MSRIYALFGDRATGIDRTTTGQARHPAFSGPVIYLNQTHGALVATIDHATHLPSLTADAAVTALPNVALAIKTADCAAILLSDATAGVIGAAHSGWMGTLHDIITPTIAAMQSKGAVPSRIKAVIGPCLQKHNFLMGDDVYQAFIEMNPRYDTFFMASEREADKYCFDNAGLITWQLQQNGVTDIVAEPLCTLDNAHDYYSHRARHTDPEHSMMRNVSLIWQTN